MKHRRAAAWCLALLCLGAGPVWAKKEKAPSPAPGEGESLVVISREKKSASSAVVFEVFIDGEEVGTLENGEKFEVVVKSGRHEVMINNAKYKKKFKEDHPSWRAADLMVLIEQRLTFTAEKKRIDFVFRPTINGFELVNETIHLRRNALYYWEGDNFTMYLRFYDDGRVINANLPGAYKPDIVRWFNESYGDNGGTYTLREDDVSFSTTAAEGSVDYEGLLTKQGMVLNLQSNINKNREKKLLFKYLELQGE
jgi:hypothetical protein